MKVKYKTILLPFLLLLFMLTVPAMGWNCPGLPPGLCYKCQDGVWVKYGNCWGGCPPCYGCVACLCTGGCDPGISCCTSESGLTGVCCPVACPCHNHRCCNSDLCESCFYGVACLVCDGNPNMKCCSNRECRYKCQIVDGESCKIPFFPDLDCSLNNCAIAGEQCTRVTRIIWSGATGKICNPEGCPGDCQEEIDWCWKKYWCVKSEDYEYMSVCTNFYCLTGWGCWDKGYWSCESNVPFPTKCYGCVQSPNPIDMHYVRLDFCLN